MKRKIITVITVLLFSILFPIIAYSHPGRTDASGGHWDRSNGTYHYHNGGSSSNSGGSGSYSYDYETTKKTLYASKVNITDPPKKMDIGESVNLKAYVYPTDAEDDEIIWESEKPDVAKITPDNKLLAVGVGTTTIIAKTSRGTSSSFIVEINEVIANSISIQNNNKTMLIEDSQKLEINFVPDNTTYKDVVWISSDDSILTVDNDGEILAVGLGKAKITATHKELKDSFEIEVLPIKADKISIICLDKLERDEKLDILKIDINDTCIFEANISPSNTTDKTITWSVNDDEKASIDNDGMFIGLKSGVVTVTAETENGIKDSIEIKVYNDSPIAILLIVFIVAGAAGCLYISRKKKTIK